MYPWACSAESWWPDLCAAHNRPANPISHDAMVLSLPKTPSALKSLMLSVSAAKLPCLCSAIIPIHKDRAPH